MSSSWTIPIRRNQTLVICGCALALYIIHRRRQNTTGRNSSRQADGWPLWKACIDTIEAWRLLAGSCRSLFEEVNDYVRGRAHPGSCPPKLSRVLRLVSCPEATQAASSFVKATFRSESEPKFLESVIEAALSDRGRKLVATVSARSVEALVITLRQHQPGQTPRLNVLFDKLLSWLSSSYGQAAACKLVATFVSCGVATYCDKTAASNNFEHIISALDKPSNLRAARSMTSALCESGVGAIVNSLRKVQSYPAESSLPFPVPASDSVSPGRQKNSFEVPAISSRERAAVPKGSFMEEIIRVCASPDMRDTCATMVKAGCSGAMEATLLSIKNANLPIYYPSKEVQKLLVSIILAWLLFLPLLFLHRLWIAPVSG